MASTEAALQTLIDRIVDQFRPRRLILFGSHARGTAGAASDVDILVVFDEVADKRQKAIELRRALADLPIAKDFVVTTPDEIARRGHIVGTVLRAALREGCVVYEAECPQRSSR
jgi:predicted nucleotidyltransferase